MMAGLVVALAFAIATAPLAAEAQAGKVYRIGYLPSAGAADGISESFRQALRQLGYVAGQNLLIQARFAERKLDRLPDLAAELVRLTPDVIVTITTWPAG